MIFMTPTSLVELVCFGLGMKQNGLDHSGAFSGRCGNAYFPPAFSSLGFVKLVLVLSRKRMSFEKSNLEGKGLHFQW